MDSLVLLSRELCALFYIHSPLFPLGAVEHLIAQSPTHHLQFLYLGHFWSLCVEEQFYLVWPLIVFFVRDRVRLRNFCVVVCSLTLVARIVCIFLVPDAYLAAGLLYRATPLRVDALLLGGLVALCLRGPEAERVERLAKPVLLLFTGGFVIWQTLYWRFSGLHHAYHPGPDPTLTTVGYTLIDIFCAALILAVLRPGGVLFRIFSLKWPRRLGQISYGFYVFHDMFHGVWGGLSNHFLRRTRFSGVGTDLLAFAGTLVISYLSFEYFEKPFLRLKDRFVN